MNHGFVLPKYMEIVSMSLFICERNKILYYGTEGVLWNVVDMM